MKNAGGRKIKIQDGKTAIDVQIGAGDVGADPALSITARTLTAEAAGKPSPAETGLGVVVTLGFSDDAAAGTAAGYID